MTQFSDFALDEAILKSLKRISYETPSPIQAQAIPTVLEGHDVIGLAETGSGKTAACAIPVCQKIDISRGDTQALIVVPTRELALQYATELQKIGKDKGVKAFALFGGESQSLQESKLRAGVHVLVATPGRLIDLIYQRVIDLSHVEMLILDEADEMLSMGFYDDLEFIIQCLVHEHQTMLFSATMPKEISKIAKSHMKDPQEIRLTAKRASPKLITHKFYLTSQDKRSAALEALIEEEKPKQAIIFCQSRVQVEKVSGFLRQKHRDVDFLHGGLGQSVRTIITDKFRRGRIRLLVATDVAARGLDFSGLSHVLIYQMSSDLDAYVHRTGRCGRADREGTAVTLVTPREQRLVDGAMKKVGREAVWLNGGNEAKTQDKAPSRRRRRPPRSGKKTTRKEGAGRPEGRQQ